MADEKKKSEDQKPLAVTPEAKKAAPTPAPDAEAPQIASEQPQEPNLGQPAMPESTLGTDVAPGEQIPPERMKQAEHLAENPNAEAQFRGKQEFHNTLRNFGEKEALNRGSMVALDPNDPDYLKKLAAHQAQEGMLREQKAHYQQSHPWGQIESAHPGVLGKIGHAFGEIGNIAGTAFAPALMPSIPGSQANIAAKAEGGEKEQAAGEEAAGKAATTAATEAEAPLRGAQTEATQAEVPLREAQTQQLQNKPDPQTMLQDYTAAVREAIEHGVDPATSPKVRQLQDAITGIQKETTTPRQNPEQQFIDDFFRRNPNGTMADAIRAYAQASQKPERGGAGDARGDKSYQLQSTRLDKVRAPIEQLQGRLSRLQDTLNQHNPQADALVAPELLTVMAGGQGSGLRMNEAEIARIVGGRSVWENLKGSIQHWSTDPASARSITPDQDKMIRALVDTVHQKLNAKQQIIDKAEEDLLNSDNPHDHRQIVINARKQVDAIDAGGTTPAGGSLAATHIYDPTTGAVKAVGAH